MERKTFATFGFLAILLLSVGLVSAATVTGMTLDFDGQGASSDKISGDAGTIESFTIELNHSNDSLGEVFVNWTGDVTFFTDIASVNDTQGNGTIEPYTFEFTLPSSGIEETITAHIYNSTNLSQKFGTKTKTVNYNVTGTTTEDPILGCTDPDASNHNLTATPGNANSKVCTYDETTLCEHKGFTENSTLEISDFDINVIGEGKDDEWQYLDKIEIIVEVENTHDDEDVKDVEVRIVIMDGKIEDGGNDVTGDFDFDEDILTDIGTLKDGRSNREDVTFTIDEISPEDLDSGTYYMYVMAYEDGNEAGQCESKESKLGDSDYFFEFDIESVDDDEAVAAKGIGIDAPISAYCGQQNLEISIPVYNLGDNDEERVLVILSDSELGIYESKVIRNLDSGDKEELTFFVDIPSELSKEKYNLDVAVYFDWDEDEDDENPSNYDDETSDEEVRLEVLSCQGPAPSINANLASATEVGTDLIVKAIVTNNGDDNDFVIALSGFESWAEIVSINPQAASIKEGEFTEVTITLKPTASGPQTFKIDATVDGETFGQPVAVNIAEDKGIFSGMNDALTYTIIGIIAILVLIFLVLVAKISRRSAKPQF